MITFQLPVNRLSIGRVLRDGEKVGELYDGRGYMPHERAWSVMMRCGSLTWSGYGRTPQEAWVAALIEGRKRADEISDHVDALADAEVSLALPTAERKETT